MDEKRHQWRTPKFIDGFNCGSKGENNGRKRNWGAFLAHNTLGVEGCAGTLGWGFKKWKASQLLTQTYTNQTSWLMHSWSTFGAQMSHGQTRIHKTHHGLGLGEATTFLLIVFFMFNHGANTQMSTMPHQYVLSFAHHHRPLQQHLHLMQLKFEHLKSLKMPWSLHQLYRLTLFNLALVSWILEKELFSSPSSL